MRQGPLQSQPILWICFTALISTCTLPDWLPLSITDTLKGPGLGSRTLALYSGSMDTMNLEDLWSHAFVSLRIFWIIFQFTQRYLSPPNWKLVNWKAPEKIWKHTEECLPRTVHHTLGCSIWDINKCHSFLVSVWNFTSCITKNSK